MLGGILLPLPFNQPFTYKSAESLQIGQLVEVPFGRDKQIGVIYELSPQNDVPAEKIKSISKVYDFPPLSEKLLKFIAWVARYNMAPLGLVFKMAVSVKAAFEPSPLTVLYKLSGKTLAEAKLKNSDALACYGFAKACALYKARNCQRRWRGAERDKNADRQRRAGAGICGK